jgi:uncharacterized protein YutE (UPF0331/DUF86 family)
MTEEIINRIAARHQVFGMLCYEMHTSYRMHNYTAALACLFILVELSLKYSMELDDKSGLYKVIEKAWSSGIIDQEEYSELQKIREIRNMMLHEDHYSYAAEIDGLINPIYEDETKKLLYKRHSLAVLQLVDRIVKI